MIQSKYIYNILDLLLDGDEEGFSARNQLEYLTENEFEYTGSGVFINFTHEETAKKFKSKKEDLILNGVKIQTSEYEIEADATLFFSDGIIDYVEIWCYLGDYPKEDLEKYTLTQVWENSPEKQITTEI